MTSTKEFAKLPLTDMATEMNRLSGEMEKRCPQDRKLSNGTIKDGATGEIHEQPWDDIRDFQDGFGS